MPGSTARTGVRRGARCEALPKLVLSALLVAFGALACSDAPPRTASFDAAACAALSEHAPPRTAVTSADWMEATGDPGAPGVLPSHCRVQGVIGARVGHAGVAYGTRFELRLPSAWTGRFVFQGGFGTDGSVAPAVGGVVGGSALALGFAVVSTDAGHEGSGQEFGLDADARLDWGYRAIEPVARVAESLIAQAYGRVPEHSYFLGCSNGGRQGFVAAQRFPELFDGIVAGAPGFDLPRAAIAEAWNEQAVAPLATRLDPQGHPYLPDTFSDADLAVLSKGVLDACDAADGLLDGIIDDLPACRFDPSALRCAGEKDPGCLSEGQVAAIDKIFRGPHDSQGNALYTGFPYDAGIGDPGPVSSLRGWTLGLATGPSNTAANATLGAGALAFLFVTPPVETTDPLGFLLGFDFDRDAPKIFATSGEFTEAAMSYVAATSTDLSPFRRRRGRMIVYHGASDGVFSANDTIGWYQGVDDAAGGHASDFVRLFLVPGMGHCLGGPSTSRFDMLDAIVAWVERGEAPDRIVATALPGSPFPGRTRPLCPYPMQTRYLGAGSPEDAESFTCRLP